jgi:alkylation response protein AidB-like acyl-CoA dehydrogenase
VPVDFDLSPAQVKLKYETREFAREVLRPVSERADAQPDPQQAFAMMRPVYQQAARLGLTTMFVPERTAVEAPRWSTS